MKIGIRSDNKDDGAIENSQIAHDPQHSFLLRTYSVRGAHEFCRTAKFGMNASGCHLRGCFTALARVLPHRYQRLDQPQWAAIRL